MSSNGRTPQDGRITVNIRNLAVGGSGVGEVVAQEGGSRELLGITAFVPFTAVGEVVTAEVVERKERYVKAELAVVNTPSEERVTPECRYYMNCGGCELQHMSYDSQLQAKHAMIVGALKAAKLPSNVLERVAPVARGVPYGYRRRLTLHVDASGRVGFYRPSSRSVVSIECCPVSRPAIDAQLGRIQQFGSTVRGKISSILLEEDEKGTVAVLKAPYALSPAQRNEILAAAREHFQNVLLTVADQEVGGYGRQILELPLRQKSALTLRVPAGYFSQVNWQVNQQLIERVVASAQIKPNHRVHDLYAGAGNFALPLAHAGAQVTAVECDKRLASFGRENAVRYNLGKKLDYIENSVERFLKQRPANQQIETIIADPPRSGLGKLVPALQYSQNFLLISCHLPSFVRDLAALLQLGWKPETIEPFDMFAQTSYVEILGVLRR